jgi:hypothetical protein
MAIPYSAASNYKRKITRFYKKIARKEFSEKISALIPDANNAELLFKAMEEFAWKPKKTALTFFPVSNLIEGQNILNEIQNHAMAYALNEISLDEKRIIQEALKTTITKESVEKLRESILPDSI